MWNAILAIQLLVSPATPHLGPLGMEVQPGETLRVAVTGSGRPVVIIPGLFGAIEGFSRLSDSLVASGYRVLIVEPLGVGSSGRPAHADYSLTAQAGRIAAVMEELDMQPAVVVAHSVGAAIALRLALLRPELVAAVVSLEGGPAETIATAGLRRALKMAPLLKLFGSGPLRGKIARNLRAASGDTTWLTDSVVRVYTSGPARDLGATLRALKGMVNAVEPWPLGPALERITCPVVLVQGLAPHDGSPDEAARAKMETIPHFTLEALPGVGHYVFEETPDLVVGIIKRAAPAAGLEQDPQLPFMRHQTMSLDYRERARP
ncbi:MAG TPA: alpha/beta hydrolase [Gemmatimonadales bacterium]|nr:alpha/beta hydrolase [Gemmatimonadales bacterium]